MVICKHEWNDVFDEQKDIIEVEFTHIMIHVKCHKCGMNGTVDSDINWKPVFWKDVGLIDDY